MFIALLSPLLLCSFPEKAKWLTPAQKTYLFQKLEADHGQAQTEKVGPRTVLNVGKDPVLWLQGSVYMFSKPLLLGLNGQAIPQPFIDRVCQSERDS